MFFRAVVSKSYIPMLAAVKAAVLKEVEVALLSGTVVLKLEVDINDCSGGKLTRFQGL